MVHEILNMLKNAAEYVKHQALCQKLIMDNYNGYLISYIMFEPLNMRFCFDYYSSFNFLLQKYWMYAQLFSKVFCLDVLPTVFTDFTILLL